jgi:hypothetical protein
MVVFPAPSDQIDLQWPLLLRFLLPAIEGTNGRWLPDDVLEAIRSGGMQVWLIAEGTTLYGVGVTRIVVYPQLKALECMWLGGVEAERWIRELDRVVCEWAAEQGCSRLEMIARKGWERMGRPIGFVPRFVVFEKEVDDGRRKDAGVEQAGFDDGCAAVAAGPVQESLTDGV